MDKFVAPLKKTLKYLLDTISPKTSRLVDISHTTARDVWDVIPRADDNEGFGHEHIYPLFDYKDPLIRSLIWQLKYKKDSHALKVLSEILHDECVGIFADDIDAGIARSPVIVLPTPISWRRLLHRGYNQCALLARGIATYDKAGVFEVCENILYKSGHTKPQTECDTKEARLANLKKAFSIKHGEMLFGRIVLIIDDVTTTGSTLREIKKTLRKYKPRKIVCVAIAH